MFYQFFSLETWLLDCAIESFLLFSIVYLVRLFFLRRVSASDRNFIVLAGFSSSILLLILNALQTEEEIFRSYIAVSNFSFVRFALTVWCLGTLLFLGGHLFKIIHVEISNYSLSRLLRPWNPSFYLEIANDQGINHPPNLYVVPKSTSTSIQGLFRSAIKVSEDFLDCPILEQKQVLIHELGHYKRRDLLSSFTTHLVLSIFWPIPMVWALARGLALDIERACDDVVLKSGFKPREYAETLIAAFERQPLTETNGIFELDAIPMRSVEEQSIFRWVLTRLTKETTFHKRLLSIINPKSIRQANFGFRVTCLSTLLISAYFCSESNLLTSSLSPTSPTTLRIPILTTSDDAEEDMATGKVLVASRDLDFSYDKQLKIHPMVGLRFCDIDIPRGAQIISSKISFVGDTTAKGSPALSIACQQDPNPAPFLKRATDISARFTGKEKRISWIPGSDWYGVAKTEDTKTPELKELVQELVDSAGWDLGQSIVFGITSNESDPFNYRESAAYDHRLGPEAAPVLEVTYQRYSASY